MPSVTINKTGRRSAEGGLFEAEGVKVTPSVLFYPEQKITIPISTITAVEEKEKIDVPYDSGFSTTLLCYTAAGFGLFFMYWNVTLCLGDYRKMADVRFLVYFWFFNILILPMFIPLLISFFKPPQATEEKRSFFEKIHLSSGGKPLVIQFSERRLANGFNRAVNAAIAAHV